MEERNGTHVVIHFLIMSLPNQIRVSFAFYLGFSVLFFHLTIKK
jgi:hypothetical protein